MRDLALQAIARQPLYFVEGSLRFALRIFNGVEIRLRDHEAERKDVDWDERTRAPAGITRSEDDARFANGLLKVWQPPSGRRCRWCCSGSACCSLLPGWRPGLLVGAASHS